MNDKVSRLAPTGKMDRDSDPRYVGKGDSAGDYRDARNVQRVTPEEGDMGSVEPTLGNGFAFDLGSVSQKNKRYRITFDGDATKQHEARFLSTQRDANMVVGTVQFNGTQGSFVSAFNTAISGSGVSWVLSVIGADTVEIELASYPMYQWFLDSVGPDVADITCIAEAIPVDLAGPLKDIGSYDLLGDLFVFSTTQDNEPTAITPTIILVGPTSGGVPNTYLGPLTSITFNGDHGLVQGQWIRITGSNEAFLNGLFVVHSVVDPQTVRIVTSTAWGIAPPVTTLGTPQVFIHPTGIGEIGVAQKDDNTDTWTYTRLLRSVELNFASRWQIDCHGQKDASGQNIYYTDDYNVPRRFRYRGEYIVDGAIESVSDLGQFIFDNIKEASSLCIKSPVVTFSLVNQYASGGSLSSGNKYYSVRYVFTAEDFSPWSSISGGVPVFERNPDADVPYTVTGTIVQTTKRNEILVSGLDISVAREIEFAVIESTEGVLSASVITRLPISGQEMVFTHSGDEPGSTSIDVAEIIPRSDQHLPLKAKSIRSIDSRNVLTNVETINKIDLSPWTRTFKHSIKRKLITESTGHQVGEYQIPLSSLNDKGFMLNETVRVGCRAHIRGVGSTDIFWVDDIRVDPNPVNTSNPDGENRRNSTIPNYDLFVEDVSPDRTTLESASKVIPGLATGSALDPAFLDQYGVSWGPTGGSGWNYYSGTGSVQSEFFQNTSPPIQSSSIGKVVVPYIEIEDIDFSFFIKELSASAFEVVEAIEFFIGDTPFCVKASGLGVMSVETPDTSVDFPGQNFDLFNGGFVDNNPSISFLHTTAFSRWPVAADKYILEWPFFSGSKIRGLSGSAISNVIVNSAIAATYPCSHLSRGHKFTERRDVISFYSGDSVMNLGDFTGEELLVIGAYDFQNNIAKTRVFQEYKNVTGRDRSVRSDSFWAKLVAHKTIATYDSYQIQSQVYIDSQVSPNPEALTYNTDIGDTSANLQLPFLSDRVGKDQIGAVFIDGQERFSKRLPIIFSFFERDAANNVNRTGFGSSLINQRGPVIKLSAPIDMESQLISPSFANNQNILRYSNRGGVYCQIYKDELERFPSIDNTSYNSIGSLLLYDGLSITGSHALSNGDTFSQSTLIRHRFPSMDEADISSLAAATTNYNDLADVNDQNKTDFISELANLSFSSGITLLCQNRINANLFTRDNDPTTLKKYPTRDGSGRWLGATRDETEPPQYNSSYSPSINTFLPAYFNPKDLAGGNFDFPSRVAYSLRKDESGISDEYRVFLPLNFKDLDLSFGEIFHHENVNGELFTLQPRKWQRQLFNTRGELQVSGNAIGAVIGDGSVLARDGQTLSAYGTQNKWSCMLGKSDGGKDTLYWYNAENGLFMRFGADGTIVISERARFRSYANGAAKWLRGKDTPAFEQGIRAVWDDRSKEVIWTFTGWRTITPWQNSGQFLVQSTVGTVVANPNAASDTYENLPRFFRCTVAHANSSSREPGVGADWQDFWEQIAYDDFEYYSVFTVAYNEMVNGFSTFYGHIPKTYLKWRDTFLSSHPTIRNLLFEHRKGLPGTWYGRAGVSEPKIEDAHIEMIMNELPEQSKRYTAVEVLAEETPDLIEFRTKNQYTWADQPGFKVNDDQYRAPIGRDATVTNDPQGNSRRMDGDYLRVKFVFQGQVMNRLHSIVVKFRDRLRTFRR